MFAISAILLLGLAACSNGNADADDRYDDCVPPYACGPSYAGYVPVYYQLHPYSLFFTPYASFYHFTYVSGHMTVARTSSRPFTPANVRLSAPTSPTYNKTSATIANKTGTNTSGKVNNGTTSKVNTGTSSKTNTGGGYKAPAAPPRVSTGKVGK